MEYAKNSLNTVILLTLPKMIKMLFCLRGISQLERINKIRNVKNASDYDDSLPNSKPALLALSKSAGFSTKSFHPNSLC